MTESLLRPIVLAAAAATEDGGLKEFLYARADALASNDYGPSDALWLSLNSTIDPTIGPYEVGLTITERATRNCSFGYACADTVLTLFFFSFSRTPTRYLRTKLSSRRTSASFDRTRPRSYRS